MTPQEQVARALATYDISHYPNILTDEQYKALEHLLKVVRLDFMKDDKLRESYVELWKLKAAEERNKPIVHICKIHKDCFQEDDESWLHYKEYAEIAIESYENWLDKKKESK